MDPLTLFTLANGAVAAVKAGCKLYKDIQGAAGDVKSILKDLDQQFHKVYEGKPVPPEARKQLQEEKARVVELNKKDPTNVYQEIGNHLGAYYDNFYKCMAIFEEEERRAKTEVYHGDDSLGKRALQRVLMKKQLQQMEVELRELMVYQSPPELGALHTEVEEMMKVMGKEQKVLIARQMARNRVEARRRQQKLEQLYHNIAIGIGGVVVSLAIGLSFAFVVQDRIEKYPQYGTGWIPKTEEQRRKEAGPHIYVGR
jgi:hypothetical protein